MDVISDCAIRVGSVLWQSRPGSFVLTVVCKAMYHLRPVTSPLAAQQEEPNELDGYWDDDERRSVSAPSDLAPFKRQADILLVGHAWAPGRQPVRSLVAGLTVGTLDKAIEVHGDRAWTLGRRLSEGAPFVKMSLRWERAAGGQGTMNPVGVPSTLQPDFRGLSVIPNLLPAGFRLMSPADVIPPVGTGPIAPTWPERLARLGKHATSWDNHAWQLRPLPEDLDATFFNVAPSDQQVSQIRCDERIVLENLHPDHPRLATKLDRVMPRAVVQRAGVGTQEVRLRCDTLVIDTDRGICSLTWRGAVPLRHQAESGRVVVTAERLPATHGDDEALATMFLGLVPEASVHTEPVLPFVDAAPGFEALRGNDQRSTPHVSERGWTQSIRQTEDTGTLSPGMMPVAAPLPFVGSRAGSPGATLPPAAPAADKGMAEERPEASFATEDLAPTLPPGPLVSECMMATSTAGTIEPRRPELLGSVCVEPGERSAPQAQVPPPTSSGSESSGVGEEQEAEPLPDLTRFPIERFAHIAAEIAEGRAPRAEVFSGHGITSGAWDALDRHFAAAIEEEMLRGASVLRRASDSAYVAAVEAFRGPITLTHYARIVVAIERGQANRVLDELRIQRRALMPIVRLWAKKVAGDMKLTDEANTLLAALRTR